MRYYYEKPDISRHVFGEVYACGHPLYDRCTLFRIGKKGLAVIQQRFDAETKRTWWGEADYWAANAIYTHEGFRLYFEKKAAEPEGGIYPTVAVRQAMWALRMKPMPRERWETVFDRAYV